MNFDDITNMVVLIRKNTASRPDLTFEQFVEENPYLKHKIKLHHLQNLFSLVISHPPDIESKTISEIFMFSTKKAKRKTVVVPTTKEFTTEDNYVAQFFSLVAKYAYIKPRPKRLYLLYDDKKSSVDFSEQYMTTADTEEDSTFPTDAETEFILRKISFSKLGLGLHSRSKEAREYKNFTRPIGMAIDMSYPRMPYFVSYLRDDNPRKRLCFIVDDHIKTEYVTIQFRRAKETFGVRDTRAMIDFAVPELVREVAAGPDFARLFSVFTNSKMFTKFIELLFPERTVPSPLATAIYPQFVVSVMRRSGPSEPPAVCPHEEVLGAMVASDPDYAKKLQLFKEEFVVLRSGSLVCKICGVMIPEFNAMSKTYVPLEASSDVYVRENIFATKRYSLFRDARRYINSMVSAYDNVFHTMRSADVTPFAKSIMDFVYHMNQHMSDLKKRFRERISKNGLFFIEMDNDFFIMEYTMRERMYDARTINRAIFTAVVLFCTLGYDDLEKVVLSVPRLWNALAAGKPPLPYRPLIKALTREFLRKSKQLENFKLREEDQDVITDTYITIYSEAYPEQFESNQSDYDANSLFMYRRPDSGTEMKYLLPVEERVLAPMSFSNDAHLPFIEKAAAVEDTGKGWVLFSQDYEFVPGIYDHVDTGPVVTSNYILFYNQKAIDIAPIQSRNGSFKIVSGTLLKTFFVDREDLLTPIRIQTTDPVFAVFNFGDPMPYLQRVFPLHQVAFRNGIMKLGPIFFKRVWVEKSRLVFDADVDRGYYVSIIYNILTYFLGSLEAVLKWAAANSELILKEYNSVVSNYYLTTA